MPELIRSIAGRLREIFGNRRRAPRYRARVEAELSLSVLQRGAKAKGPPLKLTGYTRDISLTGIALVMPAIHIGGQYITGQNRTLEIMLKLPTGLVAVKAAAVRYNPLEEEGADNGYLIGVQIIGMSEAGRERFGAYLETLTKG
jgi:c-di-GMP-binding flagellar brake protein YcgR